MGENGGRAAWHAAGAAALGAASLAGLACFMVAPRRSASVDARWAELSRHRYAHRGLHDRSLGIPENSLPAFRRARELGFGSELDVHLTADGRLAVIHDWDLSRMTGRSGTVEGLTLAELGELRLAGTKERIPAFDEVLEAYAARPGEQGAPPLVVELKTRDNVAALCERTMAVLDAADVRYCIESFDPRVLAWLRRERPEVVRGQLSQDFVRRPEGLSLPLRLGATALLGNVAGRPDFVAYRYDDLANPFRRLATGPLGGKLVAWTLTSEEQLRDVEAQGGVGIFEGFVPRA